MWKKLLSLVICILSFTIFVPSIFAMNFNVTACGDLQTTDPSGNSVYTLQNNIYATNSSQTSGCCLSLLDYPNYHFTVDFNNYGIFGGLNSSVLVGVCVAGGFPNPSNSSMTIKNGFVANFFNSSADENDGQGGIVVHAFGFGLENLTVSNMVLTNDSEGMELINVSRALISPVAIDDPYGKIGIYGQFINNSVFDLYSRAGLIAGGFTNVSNSKISGTFDTCINLVNGTSLNFQPSQGIGIVAFNNSNVVYDSLVTCGVTQGLAIDTSSYNVISNFNYTLTNSTISAIVNAEHGVWLGQYATFNKLCNVNGFISDLCLDKAWYNTALQYVFGTPYPLVSICPEKNNTVFQSCGSLGAYLNTSSTGGASLQTLMLTPLLPISIPAYPFVTFFFTPLFITVGIIMGISVLVAKETKNNLFGLYVFIGLVGFVGTFAVNFIFSFMFFVLVGFILWNEVNKHGQTKK
jgi:hypothetical protein